MYTALYIKYIIRNAIANGALLCILCHGIADLRADMLVCVHAYLGSARLLLFFVHNSSSLSLSLCILYVFFLISLYTWFFLFMQLMSAFDTAALVPAAAVAAAAVYIVFARYYLFFCVYQMLWRAI